MEGSTLPWPLFHLIFVAVCPPEKKKYLYVFTPEYMVVHKGASSFQDRALR